MEKYKKILELFKAEKAVGYSYEELSKVKAEVGELPSELEKFYLYCGNTPELHGLQDELILPNRYPALIDPEYIVFFNENQGVCQAAVKKSDTALGDPPVYTSVDDSVWTLGSPRFSEFITAMFDYQASICLEYSPEEFYFITPEEKIKIESLFKKVGKFDKWLYDCDITVYGENGGRVALMDTGGDIQMNYAANERQEFERMKKLIKGIGEPI